MTRGAVRTTYRQLLEILTEEMLDVVEEEFGGGLFGKAAKVGAAAVTKRIQREMREQGDVVVAYAAAVADGDDDVSRFRGAFLDTNPVYQRYDGTDKQELEEHLLSHFRTVGADLAPLVASESDDFWEALKAEYSREEAEEILDRHFSQAQTFKKYKGDLFRSQTLARRVISIIEKGEVRLEEHTQRELNRTYDSEEYP